MVTTVYETNTSAPKHNHINMEIDEVEYTDSIDELAALANGFSTMLTVYPRVMKHDAPIVVQPLPNTANDYGVFTIEPIDAGVYLGDVQGLRKYVWEVVPNEFTLFIDDEYVIDMNNIPRDVCAYIREDFYEGLDPNCELVRFGGNDGFLHVGFRTLRRLSAGEELVYRRSQELWIEPM